MPNNYLPQLIQIRPQYTPNQTTATTPQNVLWFRSNAPGTPSLANLQTIGTDFDTAWKAVFLAYAGQDASYLGSVVTDWSSNTGLVSSSVGSFVATPGTHGESMAGSVAALVSYKVPMRWRGGHFRTYLPYVGLATQDSGDPNKITATFAAAIVTAINNTVSAMQSTSVLGGQTMMMYKQKQKSVTPELLPISTFGVGLLLASQRRRLRKVTRK